MTILLFLLTLNNVWALNLASTSPAITESLVAVGLEKSLVAVSPYCRYPKQVMKLPKVGTSLTPQWEQLLRLKSDVVLFQSTDDKKNKGRARKLGLSTKNYRFTTLKDIEQSIESLARDFGGNDKEIQATFRRERKKLQSLKKKEQVLAVLNFKMKKGVVTQAIVVGDKNHFHDMIELAGYRNVAHFSGFRNWTRETLLKKKIERLLVFNSSLTTNPLAKDPLLASYPLTLINHPAVETVGPRVAIVMKELYDKSSP